MSNKKAAKVPVSKERFLEVLKARNCSIRKLGEAYEFIQRTEKTIRRSLDDEMMSPELLFRISKYLNINPEYLSGSFDEKKAQIEDEYLRRLYSQSTAINYQPFLISQLEKFDFAQYYECILTINHISNQQFESLSSDERIHFKQELALAIYEVIAKFFKTDSMGHNTSEELEYRRSYAFDIDPTSALAQEEEEISTQA